MYVPGTARSPKTHASFPANGPPRPPVIVSTKSVSPVLGVYWAMKGQTVTVIGPYSHQLRDKTVCLDLRNAQYVPPAVPVATSPPSPRCTPNTLTVSGPQARSGNTEATLGLGLNSNCATSKFALVTNRV